MQKTNVQLFLLSVSKLHIPENKEHEFVILFT